MRGDVGFPVRLRFTKHGKVRFVGHRDLARSFERSFRIAALPLSFSLGFSPRPKVSLGLALGVGHESDGEYLDLELVEPIDVEALPATLTETLPVGVEVTGA
ncbi:MAG: TIGR03936 family radical SAM-associated protein, partial [Acidimicrobiia bacterium]|nr:TIGR03936 family radical SAM-associated protein [Acidimicrobiia bacterium]